MSRENLAQSLDAVETALTHMADQLARGGFEAGAATYTEMANVILGQRLWAQSNNIADFDGRFDKVARLASDIYEQLHPYCSAMQKLRALPGLAVEEQFLDQTDCKIVAVLEDAGKPLTATAVAGATGCPSAETRRRLAALSERDVIERLGSPSRPRFRTARLGPGR